jgi:inorganic triphosphatase YgiF
VSREIELKLQVPASARKALAAAIRATAAGAQSLAMSARYFDTPDRRLAAEGIAWRLRRQGGTCWQTLKAGGASLHERFEHEVPVPGDDADPQRHAGTPVGHRLLSVLEQARHDGHAVEVRYRTEIRRLWTRVRTRGAVVEIAFDEGRILGGDREARVCEIEFELVSGNPDALIALASRWQARHGLWLDPRTKSFIGDRLAEGQSLAPPRRARRPEYEATASPAQAFVAVLDECLAQVLHNAAALCSDAAEDRATSVHQLRVGMRRLRAGLRLFDGWVAAPPSELVDGWRELFAKLGATRDRDVLDQGVAQALLASGGPALRLTPAAGGSPDPAQLLRDPAAQTLWLGWLRWRGSLVEGIEAAEAERLGPRLAKRLARWHARLADEARQVTSLDEAALHDLRKRIKRQRYAVEFAAPLMRRDRNATYLERLVAAQERLGTVNDLLVARGHYQQLVTDDPAAWFALGWLAARIAEATADAAPALHSLAETKPPVHRRRR